MFLFFFCSKFMNKILFFLCNSPLSEYQRLKPQVTFRGQTKCFLLLSPSKKSCCSLFLSLFLTLVRSLSLSLSLDIFTSYKSPSLTCLTRALRAFNFSCYLVFLHPILVPFTLEQKYSLV